MFYKETKLLVSSRCSGIQYSCWYFSRLRGRRNIIPNARKRVAWRCASSRNAASAYPSQFIGSNSCYAVDHVRRLTSPVIRRDDNDNNQPEQVVDVPKHEVGVPSIKRSNTLSFTNGNEWQKQVKVESRSKKATFPAMRFDVELSTEQNYGCFGSDEHKFYGEFADIRRCLDYTFHSNYVKERQLFQDDIIIQTLEDPIITDLHGNTCARPEYPWLVFTAGAMGAGKSYTIDRLVEKGRFPLTAFVRVDPDEIRRQMPEFQEYLMEESTRNIAGELTRKEAGYICEILTAAALREGKNVLVDGSLRDADWYMEYFQQLRNDFPFLRIAILHITAPKEIVLERAARRALVTGRVVPQQTLDMAFEQVPRSVRKLSPLADYFCELSNAGSPDCKTDDEDEIKIVTEGETWLKFQSKWYQLCAEWY